MRRLHRKRGVTLAEVLVATAFLGICAGALTDSATQALANIARSERRAVALAALRDRMEVTVQQARSSGSLPSVITTNATLPGGKVAVVKTTPSWSTYTSVAKIVGVAAWNEEKGSRKYTESLTVETYVRCPDAN